MNAYINQQKAPRRRITWGIFKNSKERGDCKLMAKDPSLAIQTSSMIAISALSPRRRTVRMMRV